MKPFRLIKNRDIRHKRGKTSSRKKRLSFIRIKNEIRAGIRHCYAMAKFPAEWEKDALYMEGKAKIIAKDGWPYIKKEHRLKQNYVSCEAFVEATEEDKAKGEMTMTVKFFIR